VKKIKCLLPRSLFMVIVFYGILFLFPFSAVGQEGSYFEEQDELEANVNIEISWNKHDEQENSNLEESGSLSASISGNLVLMENRSGVVLFYPGEKGLNARVSYQNITTDKKTGEQYVTENGSGNIQILSPQMVTDTQKQGHMEWMGFSGPAGAAHALQLSGQADIAGLMQAMTGKQKMDHYGFSFTAPIPAVITEKDGKSTEGSVVIHFGLIAEALKQGTNSNSVSWTSKEKEYGFFYQNFMGTKYDPPESGDVQYKVSWSFGEPSPGVEIQREVNGKWTDITDKTVSVIVGEKIKIRAMVIPEDKDTGNGHWSIPGQTIKEFIVGEDWGHADWLGEQDLETQEINFHWWDGGNGLEIRYTTNSTDGKNLNGTAVFDVKEPEIMFYSNIGEGKFDVVEVRYKDLNGMIHEGKELILDSNTGYSICFKHEPLPAEFQPDSTQYLQYVYTEGRVTKHKEVLSGPCMQIKIGGLDGQYPYSPGPETSDTPGIPVSIYDLTIDVENKFIMQLMYRPELEGAIFVPISEIAWTWTGKGSRNKITDDWDTSGSGLSAEDSSTPSESYLEWDYISTGEDTWDACE